MKSSLALVSAAMLLLGTATAHSQNRSLEVAKHNAVLRQQGSKAVTEFIDACADGDRAQLQAALTDDATLELPLNEPGTYLLVDAASAAEFCAAGGAAGHATSVRLYPTDEHGAVVSFEQGNRAHLMFIEMRAGRISKLRDFTASSERVARYAAGETFNDKVSP